MHKPPLHLQKAADETGLRKFTAEMRDKLRYSREVKGRVGWQDPVQCSIERLAAMLVDHVYKGDPVDIANLAMMLHQRGATVEDIRNAFVAQANTVAAATAMTGA
jgi:hypothetical protein